MHPTVAATAAAAATTIWFFPSATAIDIHSNMKTAHAIFAQLYEAANSKKLFL